MNIKIKHIELQDWQAIAKIYGQGLGTGIATFETEIPSWEQWNTSHLSVCRFAALSTNKLVGWAALSPVSSRRVYSGVAEVSVYIDSHFSGNGIGSKLLKTLIQESENEGIWTLQSSIFPQNNVSIHLHENMGFRKIGHREKVGKRDGIWHDNILMERRSKLVGLE